MSCEYKERLIFETGGKSFKNQKLVKNKKGKEKVMRKS